MQMKFVVKKALSSGDRVGALEIGSCPGSMETPALLLSTRKGLPHFISPDLLTSLPSPDSHLLQISSLHFLEGLASTTISKLGGLHQMLALNQYRIVAIARDSTQCLPESKGTTKLGASFETPCGRLLIKPKDYVEMISCMRPNILVTLANEVPAWVFDKTNKTSVDRTVRWLDDCLKLNPAVGSIFGSIVGGPNLDERKRCAKEVSMRNVLGFWIGGFGLGEDIDERTALLSAIIAFMVIVRNTKRVGYTYELTLKVKGEWTIQGEKKLIGGHIDFPEFSFGELDDLQMEVRLSEIRDILHEYKTQICNDLKLFLQPVREKLLQFEEELRDR